MEECLLLMGASVLAWLMITLASDAEPDPRKDLDELWIDIGGES